MIQLIPSRRRRLVVFGLQPNGPMTFKFLLVLIQYEVLDFLKIPKNCFRGSKNQLLHPAVTETLLTDYGWDPVNLPTIRPQTTNRARETTRVFFVPSFLAVSGFQLNISSGPPPARLYLHS
jgi:hypothetical protein